MTNHEEIFMKQAIDLSRAAVAHGNEPFGAVLVKDESTRFGPKAFKRLGGIYAMFRMFSRDHQKRYAENQKYLSMMHGGSGSVRQFIVRLKNIRKYKYFKCPECHSRLRLPRKVGEVTVTCGKCHHAFKQKA